MLGKLSQLTPLRSNILVKLFKLYVALEHYDFVISTWLPNFCIVFGTTLDPGNEFLMCDSSSTSCLFCWGFTRSDSEENCVSPTWFPHSCLHHLTVTTSFMVNFIGSKYEIEYKGFKHIFHVVQLIQKIIYQDYDWGVYKPMIRCKYPNMTKCLIWRVNKTFIRN